MTNLGRVSPLTLAAVILAIALVLLSVPGQAQDIHPLAQQLAGARVELQELPVLYKSEQITLSEYQERGGQTRKRISDISAQIRRLAPDQRTQVEREAESVFQTRIVPLREQWRQKLIEKQAEDQAANQARQIELTADATAASKLQAARTIYGERAQRSEFSQAEFLRVDRGVEAQVLALQQKYNAYGGPWGARFSQTVAGMVTSAVAAMRIADKLADTRSQVGQDAHRAADLTLSMQRNQVFRSLQAMSPQEQQNLDTTAQALLTSLQQKYGATSPDAADFRDRTARLVQAGSAAQRPQWERDAMAARDAATAARAAAANRPVATPTPQVAVPQANPESLPMAAPRTPTSRPQATAAAAPTQRPMGTRPSATAPIQPGPQSGPGIPTRTPTVLPSSGMSPTPILLLLLVGGAGAGVYVYRGRRASAPPRYSDVTQHYAPPPVQSGTASRPPSATLAPATTPETGAVGVKERLFAERRQKYQSRYNDALDEVTNASIVLTQMAPVVGVVEGNLRLLSQAVQARVSALLMARFGNWQTLLARAVTLRTVKHFGLLLKIIVFGVLASVVYQAFVFVVRLRTLLDFQARGLVHLQVIGIVVQAVALLLPYLVMVLVLFFVERHFLLKAPLALLKKSAEEFKNTLLIYVFNDQRPHTTTKGGSAYHAIRVSANGKHTGVQELRIPAGTDLTAGPGVFLIAIGALATYRVDPSGHVALVSSATGGGFMAAHGGLVTEAMVEHSAFAATTLPSFAEYGQAAWRKQRTAELVPQLEGLVKDVDRLETLWSDTYCSDPVFEILLRSVDMFNMRDSATPPGLLLYGYPGNGKKHLAKKIAETLSAKFEQVNPSKLSSAADMKALWETSRSISPVVLFVPNADTIFPREPGGGAFARDTLEWIAEWERHEPAESGVWVVMTAESDQSVSNDILQHIGQDLKMEVTAPDAAGRALILRSACRQHQIPGALPESVIASTGGVSIQDLRRIVMSVKRASSPNPPQETHWKAAIKNVRGADAKVKDETKTWDHLVLPAAIKAQLQAACKILQNAPEYLKKGVRVPNILLFGPPGTGKTEIARTIANESGASFIGVKLADLKADHIGGSGQSVHAKFTQARAAAPAVLFIDELDGAAGKRSSGDSDVFTKDIVSQMLAEMDGATKSDRPVFVLGATNYPDQIDDAILSRFSNRIEIPSPDQEGRSEILRRILREQAVDPMLDIDEIAATIGRQTTGLSGRDLVKLVERASQRAVLLAASPEDIFVTRELLTDEVAQLAKLAGAAVDENAKWDSLVVSDDTMSKLKQISNSLRNMEKRLEQGYEPLKGAILFGPPGTGKTQIAKTLANESGVQYLLKGLSDLQAGYIGQSALKVSALFAEARSKAPCLLFIDEFDKAAASRSGDQSGSFSSDIVTQLLGEMDGAKKTGRPVFVLAATNYLEHIDEAVRSRFSFEIEIPYPTAEQRERLFAIFLRKYPRVDFDITAMASELAHRSGDVGGRDIQQFVVRASQAAAQRAEEAGTSDAIVLTRDDLLRQFAPKGAAVSEADLQRVWSQIVLKPDVKESLLGMIRLFNAGDKAAAKGLLLYGPPGTGKTEIARLLAKSTGCKFLEVKPSDLKGSHVGESGKQVKAQWEKARAYGRCVMFLDECDGIFQRRGGVNSDSFVEEVVNEFLQLWDGVGSKGQVWVVGATNRRDRFDDAIASRFGAAVEIGLPEAAQRIAILRLEMQKLERDVEIPDFVGQLTTGFSGRTLSKTAEGVIRLAAQRGGTVTPDIWRATIATLVGATSESVDESAKWDTLILQEPTIKKLQRICQMLRHAETLQKQGIDVPRGALLFGPPGTGKTQIARTMANEGGMTFIAAGPSDIKAGFVGQSGLKVRELFERAQGSAPCILFIDEIEASAAARDGGKADQFTNEIVTEMLTRMDGVKKRVTGRPVFVLAASNFQHLIDAAVLSRFDDRIEIPNPGVEERRRMIATFVGKRRVDFDINVVAEDLAARCEGMSGRDINALVRRASLQAAQRALDAGTPEEIVLTRDDLASECSSAGHDKV